MLSAGGGKGHSYFILFIYLFIFCCCFSTVILFPLVFSISLFHLSTTYSVFFLPFSDSPGDDTK